MRRMLLFFSLLFIALPLMADESVDFVDVGELDNTVVLDIRYATTRNFTGKIIYPVARCLLRRDAALRLLRVEQKLKKQGYRLVVFDSYRPVTLQKRLWEMMPDERYVDDPTKGSPHNRGGTVDVTLADLDGIQLPMPSPYDDHSIKASRDYAEASVEALKNRALLEEAMKTEGFEAFWGEWWRFDAPGWQEYPLSDFPLRKSGGCDD